MAEHVCPWWLGYFLINPLRYLLQDPKKILKEHVKEGMTIMDVGPGMGFFSLPMARMVGQTARVVCVDIQERMLQGLLKRAKKNGLADRIDTRICSRDSLGINDLKNKIDFILAFAVIHEAPDRKEFISQICQSLKQDGKLLIAEPKSHVSKELFAEIRSTVLEYGLEEEGNPNIKRSFSVLLCKKD